MRLAFLVAVVLSCTESACLLGDRPRQFPCEEGCVKGNCRDGYTLPPKANVPDSAVDLHFLSTCTTDQANEDGKPTLLSCRGPGDTILTYDAQGRVSSAQLSEVVPVGVSTRKWTYGYGLLRKLSQYGQSGAENGAVLEARDVQLLWEGDAIVREDVMYVVRTRPQDEGEILDQRIVDGRFQRQHETRTWDADGRIMIEEVRLGASDALQRSTVFIWEEDRLVGVEVRIDSGIDGAIGEGCEHPEPGVSLCRTSLSYDDEGTLVSYEEAGGTKYAVSDHCCAFDCLEPD